MVGSHEVAGYSGALHFSKWNGPQWGPIALKRSQNIAKSMAYIINQLYGDFQQMVACTNQPVAFNGHPSTCGRLTGLTNKPQQKQTCQHLAVVYWQLVSLLMELYHCRLTVKTVLWHGVRKWRVWQSRSHMHVTGFGKTDRTGILS